MANKIKTIKDARDKVIEVINKVENRKVNLTEAKVINNGIGKIIGTVKAQLEYRRLRREKPQIAFMNCQ